MGKYKLVDLISENKMQLNEGTRAMVAYLDPEKKELTTTYNHYDGYPSNLGAGLEAHYNDNDKAKEVAMKGYITHLDPETGKISSTYNESPKVVKLQDGLEDIAREIAERIDEMGGDYGYIWHNGEWMEIKNNGIRAMMREIMTKLVGSKIVDLEEAKEDRKEGIELTQDQMDKLHKTGVITVTGVDNNGNKVKSKLYFPKVTKENKIEEVTMANVNVDEIKQHLDAFEAGTIDGNDLHQAISEIFFGEVVAPGLKEMTADEFGGDEESVARIAKFQNKPPEQVRQEVSDREYEEIADAHLNKLSPYTRKAFLKNYVDRNKLTKAQLGRRIVDKGYDGDLGKAFDAIDSKNLEEMKTDTGMFIDDDEFEMEMVKDKAKEIQPLFPDVSMEDLIDFVKTHRQDIKGMSDEEIKDEYREYQSVNVPSPSDFMEEDKALREHFGRFLKNYQ